MVLLELSTFIFMLFATIIGCVATILSIGWLIHTLITDYIDEQIDKKINIKDENKED